MTSSGALAPSVLLKRLTSELLESMARLNVPSPLMALVTLISIQPLLPVPTLLITLPTAGALL